MYVTTQGLVLRVSDYNDHDALLTLLTREYGRLTVKARGLRRKNSPLTATCQLLAYGEFTLLKTAECIRSTRPTVLNCSMAYEEISSSFPLALILPRWRR